MPQSPVQGRPNRDSAAVDPGRGAKRQTGSPPGPASYRAPRRATSYLPQVALATALVAVMPVAVVWELRSRDVISSPWLGVPLAIVLSLIASLVGSGYWKRRRGSGDLLFSELVLWGWLRRLYAEYRVSRAAEALGLTRDGKLTHSGEDGVKHRTRLLRQLAVGLDEQDAYTKGHSHRVARHATMTARKLHLPREQVAKIQTAAIVHDVGKLHVPRNLLNKPGKLTASEFQIVKCHPEAGAEMVANLGDDELTAIVRHHHERLDGSGYPDGLRGDQIPLGARIVAVVDVFDAITAPRPYRAAAPHRRAFDTLAAESGAHLDPNVVRAFRSCYSGRGPLAWWAALTTLLQWIAWPRMGGVPRRGLSSREFISTTAATAAVAAVAIAAPITQHRLAEHPKAPPTSARTSADRPSVHPRTARAATARHSSRRPSRASTATSPVLTRAPRPRPGGSALVPMPAKPSVPAATPRHPPTREPTNPPTRYPVTNPPGRTPTTPTISTPSLPPATTVNSPASPPAGPIPTSPTTAPPTTTTTSTTTTSTPMPVSKAQCRDGGYAQYGFKNQGQCVAYVEHLS